MPSVPQVLRMRRRRENSASRRMGWPAGLFVALAVSFLAAVTGIFLAFAAADLTHNLPSLEQLPLLLDLERGELLQPSRLYDRTGEQVLFTFENPASSSRRFLSAALPKPGAPFRSTNPDSFSPALVQATLAIADPYFQEHAGFSLAGIREGAHPTLAQRLVSNLLFWDEPPSLRKALRERLLAYQLTARFGREQVMAWYLNSAYYGRLAYGAESAAQVYFGKSAAELNLAEAALLAAASDTPSLNPHDAPQAARERQQQVIQVMLDRRLITEEEALQALTINLSIQPPLPRNENTSPGLTGLVVDELVKTGLQDRLQRGGVKVITTLDSRLQAQAVCTAEIQLGRLTGAASSTGPEQAEACEAARLLPTLPEAGAGENRSPETEVVLLDPGSGQVLALYATPKSSSETSPLFPQPAPHPSGTLWTPVIYLTAFARGLGPASLVWDIPAENPDEGLSPSLPLQRGYHGPVRLRIALVNDYLTPAAQVLEQVGIENAWETARELGLAGAAGDPSIASLPENGPPLTLLQAARAYGIFANNGSIAGAEAGQDAVTILDIKDYRGASWPGGNNRLAEAGQQRPVLSPQLAYLMTHILSDETARWPTLGHPNPYEIGRPAAVKTGKTPEGQETWTVGYIPQLVLGVWVGSPAASGEGAQTDNNQNESSQNAAAGLWHALMQYASRDWPPQGWTPPEGITRLEVCDPSGLLPGADCPNIVPEVFLAGSEPTHFDSLFRALQVNRETGRLATIFTPLDLVEERVFILVPPGAKPWALQAGLPVPPQEYDLVSASVPATPGVQITSPALFAYVRGKVPILGQARGEDFDYYRLQVGKGLNPDQWRKIGADMHTPVTEGRLGIWDTEGLDGLYALELLVVRSDQTAASAVVQVTVDNQPPDLTILNPGGGQAAVPTGKRYLTFQVQAEDNLAIKQVEFFVDGKSFATLVQAPYSAPWRILPGAHSLRVVATDLAGNQAETEATFMVKQ